MVVDLTNICKYFAWRPSPQHAACYPRAGWIWPYQTWLGWKEIPRNDSNFCAVVSWCVKVPTRCAESHCYSQNTIHFNCKYILKVNVSVLFAFWGWDVRGGEWRMEKALRGGPERVRTCQEYERVWTGYLQIFYKYCVAESQISNINIVLGCHEYLPKT